MKNRLLYVSLILIVLIIAIGGIYIADISFGWLSDAKSHTEKLGNWGQYLSGTIGLVLTFLTLIGVTFAYILQNKQLKQLEEESNTRGFENNFYKLLELLKELSSKKVKNPSGNHLRDTDIFDFMQNKLLTFIKDIKEDDIKTFLKGDNGLIKEIDKEKLKKYFNNCYMKFYKLSPYDISEYFRLLYNILKLISKNKTSLDRNTTLKSKFYSNILRAKLSQDEYFVIFFNALSDRAFTKKGNKHLTDYINEFELFEHFDINDINKISFNFLESNANETTTFIDRSNESNLLAITGHILSFYEPSAFGVDIKLDVYSFEEIDGSADYPNNIRIKFKSEL